MKITKRQLKRIIKEEMNEYGHSSQMDSGSRASGLYFDVEMQKRVENALSDLYENAWTAAMDDLGDVLDAENAITDGLRSMLEVWIQMNIPGGN